MPDANARRHLSAVSAPAPAHEPEMPYTEAEMEDAMGHLLARMVPLTRRTGWKVEEIIESEIFGLLALAYVAALRKNPPADALDALAFSYYIRMLASAPQGFDDVTDLIVLDSIQWCTPALDTAAQARALHLVRD
ncbi:hypothetical protein HRW14_35655 [Streptomyces lunaelactis]|uniref:hypothetical protein n=1 Tax=Streptomyces lunaelactis TaxID=1535768 RepID=UPI001585BF93|nr:hypothetical protein [Streptomyces lunaelactis]NUK55486.1 hypothetical protein [Streptomyces lunaelactis]